MPVPEHTKFVLQRLAEGPVTRPALLQDATAYIPDDVARMQGKEFLSAVAANNGALQERKIAIVEKTLNDLRIHGRITSDSTGRIHLLPSYGDQQRRIEMILLDQIVVEDRQRTGPINVDSLADSIETVGLLHPISVVLAITVTHRDKDQGTRETKKTYVLAAGARRLAAYQRLGRSAIEARVFRPRAGQTAAERARELELTENVERSEVGLSIPEMQAVLEEYLTRWREEAAQQHQEGTTKGGKIAGKGRKQSSGTSGTRAKRDQSRRPEAKAAKALNLSRRDAASLMELNERAMGRTLKNDPAGWTVDYPVQQWAASLLTKIDAKELDGKGELWTYQKALKSLRDYVKDEQAMWRQSLAPTATGAPASDAETTSSPEAQTPSTAPTTAGGSPESSNNTGTDNFAKDKPPLGDECICTCQCPRCSRLHQQ